MKNPKSEEEYKTYILEHFTYSDGVITRNDRDGGNGSLDKDGYLILKIKGRRFKAHRVAWLLNYGDFPEGELDHINRVKTDNRIENLGESNRTQQNRNKCILANSKTGVPGICEDIYTKGLKKKFYFHCKGKTYRAYTVGEALKLKERIWKETE